ncbi:alpha-hydroxyketone-type quorum-sensing autoinducer synthase [Salinisphaera sp. T31B1]|uniref:alpha-hydroxyketone-type quorum-sensing autoinducer synthase n=1 Tax=Salinisphaera sp. T31B1 TaxID=727963 RepID=UPI003341F7EB
MSVDNKSFHGPALRPRSKAEPEFLREHVDHYFRERVEKTWKGGHIMHGRTPGPDAILMVTNDYLDLANNPQILQAQIDSLRGSDNTVVMSGVYLHGDSPQLDLERRMARWMRMESSLLCQSGYAANVGLIQAIGAPGTPVYVDMFAHASLWEGVRSAGLEWKPFRHNDASHLETMIERNGPGIVVMDSVYSTTGSVAPLKALVEVANRHGCVTIVDESHSLGTHGDQGRGLVAGLGLQSEVHFVTASLAKAFAARAGLIACSERLRQFIKYNSFPAIFSSSLLPHDIAGLSRTLELIRAADAERERLHASAAYLRRHLRALGYNVDTGQAQMIALEAGPEQNTMVLRDALESRGVFGSVFCAPATATKRSLIRLSVNTSHTYAQINRVIEVCAEIRDEVDLANWPSTRRAAKRERPEDAARAA